MGSVILSLIPEWLWLALGGIIAALGYGAVKLRQGRSQGSAEAETDNLKSEIEAHERITEADIGVGASDADRIDRLQGMADKWRD